MKNNIFFDALTHSLRRFQLYLAWIDVQTSADIENCELLALIEQKCLPASLRTSWTSRIIHENDIFFDALTHSLRRFQLYLAWIDVHTSADIENCELLALNVFLRHYARRGRPE